MLGGQKKSTAQFLVAEPHDKSRQLFKQALSICGANADLQFFTSGFELIDHLKKNSPNNLADTRFQNLTHLLIFLNLNSTDPALGFDVLRNLKSDKDLKKIPVILLAEEYTSNFIKLAYELGSSSCLIKPRDIESFVTTLRAIREYWLDMVEGVTFDNCSSY